MGRPRKNKLPKSEPVVARTPFTVEVHGETIDLDLKLMLDPPDKAGAKSLDQTLADLLKVLTGKLASKTDQADIVFADDGDDALTGLVKDWAKTASDTDLINAFSAISAEMNRRDVETQAKDNLKNHPEMTVTA